MSRHRRHIGRGHTAHAAELGNLGVGTVHLGVPRHGVHVGGGGVGGVGPGRRRVDVPHHTVTGGVDDWGKRLG